MRKVTTRLAITISTLLLPAVAIAHPDHFGGGEGGLTHFLTDPFHVGSLLAAIAIPVAVAVLGRSRLRRSAVERRTRSR